MKNEADKLSFQRGADDEDEIEILEVVGLDEDSPAAGPARDGVAGREESGEITLVFDEAEGGGISDYERLTRLHADFENFKKRVEREGDATRRQAAATLVSRLLPVLDNFDRALESAADDHKKFKSFYKGIAMIEQQLYKALEDGGVRRIEAEGQPFDPNYHEAVSVMNNPDKPDDTIIAVVQKGYIYKDMVVRWY